MIFTVTLLMIWLGKARYQTNNDGYGLLEVHQYFIKFISKLSSKKPLIRNMI
jgi:hypothetical protein